MDLDYILLKSGEPYGEFGFAHKEYLIKNTAARLKIPTEGLAPGSNCHTPGCAEIYEFGFDGEWVRVGKQPEGE